MPITSRAERLSPRMVHLARRGPACQASARELLAVDAHGEDRLEWVTCPHCRVLLVPRCRVTAVTSV